jgi:hypothetical protein
MFHASQTLSHASFFVNLSFKYISFVEMRLWRYIRKYRRFVEIKLRRLLVILVVCYILYSKCPVIA